MEVTNNIHAQMTAVSLFSGAGGLDVGFEKAGFKTVFANECDHDAAETWKANRPSFTQIMVEGDINDYLQNLVAYRGVGVVYGGPPCQGFSVAGKMNPEDERSKLIWRFFDAVEITMPLVFLMENVDALGILKKWKDVRSDIIKRADSLGYDVSYKVHHTPDYGVPENRNRVIFIGVRKDIGDTKPFYTKLEEHKNPPRLARETILSAGKYGSDDNPITCTASISLATRPVMRNSPYAGMLVNGAGRPINLDGIAPTLPASMGGNKTPIVDEIALNNPSIPNWFKTYHSALKKKETSPSKTQVPLTIRRLTVKECAAIQTFPKDYIFQGAKTKQYRQIGNAVPCLFAEAVAKSIRDAYFTL
ncbi:MAG: DNA cytosine methyltransferase [Bacteroidales bacterium]|nr:DNA cytosine methyltransferase [Bacteroidales bacterium]